MASQHCEKKAPQLSAAQQANLDKLVEQAKQSYVSEDIANRACAIHAKSGGRYKVAGQSLVSLLGGAFANMAKDDVTLLDSIDWVGKYVKHFPQTISLAGLFSLTGLWAGIKAGAAYVGKNHAGKECVWLVAFAENNDLGRVMYVDCGPLSKFTSTRKIDWKPIQAKLNDASSLAHACDDETGTSIYGSIGGYDVGTVAAAAFNG